MLDAQFVDHVLQGDPAPELALLVDDLEGSRLGGARERSGREGGRENIQRVRIRPQIAFNGGHQVHNVAESLDLHELRHLDRAWNAHLEKIISCEVDEHEMLRALLGVGEKFLGQGQIFLRACAPRAGSGDGVHIYPSGIHFDESLG